MAFNKVTEKKWFQHLAKEQLGSVVQLVGIEEDDDMILFHFSDGSKCNVEFIGALNDTKAFDNNMVMAEISDPKNIWTFTEKVIVPKTKRAIDRDGQEWEIPDPYYDPKGDKGPQKEVKKIVGIPPRAVNRTKLEKFGISLGEPEQELVATITEPKVLNAQEAINEIKLAPKNENKTSTLNSVAGEPEHAVIRPSYLELNPIVGGTWTVDAEKIKEIQIVKGDKNVLIDTLKALEMFSEGNKVVEDSKKKYENDPIYILIEKCKKKEAQINISVNAALPGKSIYNLIKDEYDEADLGTFFDILIDNLDTQIIKDSIKKALVEAYSKE